MNYVMKPEALKAHIQNEDIIIIDVRSNLQNPDLGEKLYNESHIPGAYYLHVEKDLSGKVEKHGGNHPLPKIEELAKKLGGMGIDHEKSVVIYDAGNDMFAPRAWWLLHYMGHEHTYVLDGGFVAWEKAGYDVTEETPSRKRATFTPRLHPELIVDMNEVKQREKERIILIDSRAKERYLGKTEPLYKIAGHIPGSKNYFWKDVYKVENGWKDTAQLSNHFSALKGAEEIIVSCGSGISACPNILALKMAGYENVKLYSGSYSDWISYEENQVATKEE